MPARIKIDRQELAELTEQGWTLQRLAGHFNVNPASISRLRTSLGISRKPAMTEARRQRIANMIEDGWSHAEIGRTEGATPKTLRRHFPGTAWDNATAVQYRTTLRTDRQTFIHHPDKKPTQESR